MKAIAATYRLKMWNIRPENVSDIRLEIVSRPGNIRVRLYRNVMKLQ